MSNNEELQVTIWSTVEEDLEQLLLAYSSWLQQNREMFGSIGPSLVLNDDVFADMYDTVHLALSVFGDSANSCKRAATLIFAACVHCPIVAQKQTDDTISDADRRALLLANATAAYEIGEAIARIAEHEKPEGIAPWNFENRAMFPSIHSYVEFIASLAKLRSANLEIDNPRLVEQGVSRIALILELLFYRTNPKIAGTADEDFYKHILQVPGLFEFTFLNLSRNCETNVDLPE